MNKFEQMYKKLMNENLLIDNDPRRYDVINKLKEVGFTNNYITRSTGMDTIRYTLTIFHDTYNKSCKSKIDSIVKSIIPEAELTKKAPSNSDYRWSWNFKEGKPSNRKKIRSNLDPDLRFVSMQDRYDYNMDPPESEPE